MTDISDMTWVKENLRAESNRNRSIYYSFNNKDICFEKCHCKLSNF